MGTIFEVVVHEESEIWTGTGLSHKEGLLQLPTIEIELFPGGQGCTEGKSYYPVVVNMG